MTGLLRALLSLLLVLRLPKKATEILARIFDAVVTDTAPSTIAARVGEFLEVVSAHPEGSRSHDLKYQRESWVEQYHLSALCALKDVIQRHERNPAFAQCYNAKWIPLIQSSGMGKSRLVDELGKICPMVYFNLQMYPLGLPKYDLEILSFLEGPTSAQRAEILESLIKGKEGNRESELVDTICSHATVLGLLQASFQICEFASPQQLQFLLLT